MCDLLSGLYRVGQEERSTFWEVTVSVILSRKCICTCVLFRSVSEIELIRSNFGKRSYGLVKLRRLVAGFPPLRPAFEPRSSHVRSVVDQVALRKVISGYFGFCYQFSFHRLLHTHHHLSSGAGTIDQLEANVPSGLSLTPHPKKLKN
jgi:hypothetical protein